jgi:hypothetical protein
MAYSTAPLRTHHDAVLAAPLMLGYWPGDSVCAIFVDADDRVVLIMRWDHDADLAPLELPPPGPGERDPVRFHLVAFPPPGAADPEPWLRAAESVRAKGVPMAHMLLAVARGTAVAWTCVFGDGTPSCPVGDPPALITEADVARTARAWGLRPWRGDRQDFIADIALDEDALARVSEALTGQLAVGPQDRDDAIAGVLACIARQADATGADATGVDATACALVGLADVIVRDTVLWDLMHQDPSCWAEAADRLAAMVSAAPEAYVAPPATLLAILRWQLGDGTRARAALDRAIAAEPGYTLAVLVGQCLANGLHPMVWREGLDGLSREECRRSA